MLANEQPNPSTKAQIAHPTGSLSTIIIIILRKIAKSKKTETTQDMTMPQ
jgi:hypothetical protein